MRKMIHQLLLFLAVLVPLLAACGQTGEPPKPTLSLTGEPVRTVNANSVLVEGTFQSNVQIAKFSYSVNGGKTFDVLSSLQGKTFKFTVENLAQGLNIITLKAQDMSGRNTSLDLEVTANYFPDVSGVWGSQYTHYEISCDTVDNVDVLFTLEQAGNTLTGTLSLDVSGNTMVGNFTGTVSEFGQVTGTVIFTVDNQSQTALVDFYLSETTLAGRFTFQNVETCYGQRVPEVYWDVNLQKDFTVPSPATDDGLEPNNSQQEATPITLPYTNTLISTRNNADWFALDLPVNGELTARVKFLQTVNGTLTLLDEAGNSVISKNLSDQGEIKEAVNAGRYYLKLESNTETSVEYTLEASLFSLPDAAYEPNESKQKATAIASGFKQDAQVSTYDEDWFTFTLSEEQMVTFDLHTHSGVSYQVLKSTQAITDVPSEDFDGPMVQVLQPGTYYLRIFTDIFHLNYTYTYTLEFTVSNVSDSELEPNNTKETASLISSGFKRDLYLTPGDKDWYTFTLSQEQLVTLTWTRGSGGQSPSYQLTQGTSTLASLSYSNANPLVIGLPAGTYHLQFGDYFYSGSTYQHAYRLEFTTQAVPDAYEPNSSFNAAKPVTLPFNESLYMSWKDEDWLKFEVTGNKLVTLSAAVDSESCPSNFNAQLFNADGASLTTLSLPVKPTAVESYVLTTGTYYLKLQNSDSYYGICSRPYTLKVVAEDFADTDLEPNNTKEQATVIDFGFDRDIVVTSGDQDWFQFTLAQPTQIKFSLKKLTQQNIDIDLLRANDSEISLTYQINADGFSVATPILAAGTYYIKASIYSWWTLVTSKYQIKFEKR